MASRDMIKSDLNTRDYEAQKYKLFKGYLSIELYTKNLVQVVILQK